MTDGATLAKASVDGACPYEVFITTVAVKIYFASRQSGSRMESYTSTEFADMHLACGSLTALDERHSRCTPNVTPGGKLPVMPSLHTCT
ncbi:hypothetical protein TNCV_1075821 [Trichonephila clavipes]|uniref:Uncharacterized protein n=1 Tax=Trichonephila clavipes TaxID=2585209 RepID=A0A8X6SYJ5_TRICX|nr:hypothetical protein TNCV_1075821 [Trichonephila clavipes]